MLPPCGNRFVGSIPIFAFCKLLGTTRSLGLGVSENGWHTAKKGQFWYREADGTREIDKFPVHVQSNPHLYTVSITLFGMTTLPILYTFPLGLIPRATQSGVGSDFLTHSHAPGNLQTLSRTNHNWWVVDLPLWKILVIWDYFSTIRKNKKCSKPPTRQKKWCLKFWTHSITATCSWEPQHLQPSSVPCASRGQISPGTNERKSASAGTS